MKAPKIKCGNCGDEFRMPATAIGERAKRGWCTGCWNQYVKARRVNDRGEYWVDHRSEGTARGYSSRPEYTERDS